MSEDVTRSLMLCEAIRITRRIRSGDDPHIGAEVAAAAARVGAAKSAALVVADAAAPAGLAVLGRAGDSALLWDLHEALRELVLVVISDGRPLLSHTSDVSVIGLPVPALTETGGVLLVARSRDADPFGGADTARLAEFAGQLDAAWAADTDRTAQRLVRDHFRETAEVNEHVIERLFSLALELISVRRALSMDAASPRLLDAVNELDSTITWLRRSVLEPATVDRLIRAVETGSG